LWLDSYVLKEASINKGMLVSQYCVVGYVGYTYSEASRKNDRGHDCQR